MIIPWARFDFAQVEGTPHLVTAGRELDSQQSDLCQNKPLRRHAFPPLFKNLSCLLDNSPPLAQLDPHCRILPCARLSRGLEKPHVAVRLPTTERRVPPRLVLVST